VLGSSSVLPQGLTSFPLVSPGVSPASQVENELEKAFFDQGLYKEYAKLCDCGKKAVVHQCQECEKQFFTAFNCDLRICKRCAKRLAARFKHRYIPIFKKYFIRKGKDRLMHLTLTTDNKGAMPSRGEVRFHNKAIGKLVRKLFKGGVSVNEVADTFLHSHVVVYGHFVPKREISKLWNELTGCQVVWIQEIKGNVRQVANYIAKYISKPYPYKETPEGYAKAVSFLKAFKHVRRIHSFGLFYAAIEEEEKPPFACPFCRSTDVIVVYFDDERTCTIQECRIRGIPSYQEVLNIWNNTELVTARA